MRIKDFTFGGLANSLDKHKTPDDKAFGGDNCFTDEAVLQCGPRYGLIGHRPGANAADVAYGIGYARRNQNAVFKLVMDATATGGTIDLVHNGPASGGALNESTAALNHNSDAAAIQAGLEGTTDLTPGDVACYGGPWPGLPVYLEYRGQYVNTDMRTPGTTDNTLTPASSVTITEFKTGGSFEIIYVVIQPSGTGDATLYAVTSADDWETTTWTSIATNLDPSDWQILQYDDKILLLNATDGLKWLHIGHDTLSADPPEPPSRAPTFGGPFRDDTYQIGWASGTYASSGFASAPTLAASDPYLKVTLTGTETGRRVTLTATISSTDWSDNDWFTVMLRGHSGLKLDLSSIVFQLINADGSPVTIDPVAYTLRQAVEGSIETTYYVECQFGGNVRYQRDNIVKLQVVATIAFGETGDTLYVGGQSGSNWMNDTLAMGATPVRGASDYAMTYYRASDGAESKLSPVAAGPSHPVNLSGSYISVNGYGTSALGSSDLQWFYRREKGTRKWRRIPNKTTKAVADLVPTDFGVTNDPTGVSDGQYDHFMEYEIEEFPELENLGFPPQDTDVEADVMGIWKQCLAIGADRKLFLSRPGQPLQFAPSPDAGDPDIDVDDEERPSTEYVADNRAEPIYGIVGNDSLYLVTPDSAYTKIGDKPSDATVPRRLPGSRGAIAKRAVAPLGGGVMILGYDGAWYYSVGRGFSGEDNGNLTERELSQTVRKSYYDLFNTVQKLTKATLGGQFLLTLPGYGQTQVPLSGESTSDDVEAALLTIPGVNYGDVEVWGGALDLGMAMYVRFRGQFQSNDVALMTVDAANLSGPAPEVAVTKVSTGGVQSPKVFEHANEVWMLNGNRFLRNTSEQTWLQGYWADKIKDVLTVRRIGLMFLTTTGKLVKVDEKHTSDAGELVEWVYETGVVRAGREKIKALYVESRGTPTVQITTWDGIDGHHTTNHVLKEHGWTAIGIAQRPGTKYRIRVFGVAGRDELYQLQMASEPTLLGGTRK